MNFVDLKKELLANPEVCIEYENLQPEYELVRALLNARKECNMTQQELADKTGINRTNISKLENGKFNPSFAFLQKLAGGMGMTVKVEFIKRTTTNEYCEH